MSKIGEPKVRFLSLSSLQTSRGGLLLAESALFTLPSLLFAAYEGGTPVRHCFFFSLYAFCHLTDLRFSFFFLSFSHQARVLRPFPQTSTHSPALHPHPAPRCEHRRHSSGRFLSDDGDSGSTTARELRRGPRGRCPRRGDEEEALRINTDVENRRTQGSFSFLSLSSLQTSRGGLLLAESALFTLLSLLFAADSGARQLAIAFFLSLYAFCHLADLRFSFFS